MANKIQIRRDTAANWTSTNPTLSQGEQGYEIDTGKFKIGDGTTAWTSLSYLLGYTDADVDTHLNTSTATNGEYLSWDGSDYDWATVPAGYTNSDVDTHLNTSTATSGEVLSWTGTDYDWITAGGGSPDLYADNAVNATTPTATGTNDVAIGSGATASGGESIALGDGAIASGSESVALGIARAPNSGSLAINIVTNSASYGPYGNMATAIGQLNKANGIASFALGRTNHANGSGTFTYGQDNVASNAYAVAGGNYALSSIIGKRAFLLVDFLMIAVAPKQEHLLFALTPQTLPQKL